MNKNKFSVNKFYRSPIWILLSSNMICSKCLNFESNKVSQIKKMTTKQSAANLIPANLKHLFQHYPMDVLKSQFNIIGQKIKH